MAKTCVHKWAKVDEDERFRKVGKLEVKRVKEECIRCGRERTRRIKRRY